MTSVTEEEIHDETQNIVAAAAKTAAEPEKLPTFVSVTDLTSYMYCPRSLYQQKVLGYEEKPTSAMVLGTIRHKFYDLANKHEERIVVHLPAELPKEEVTAAYSATYSSVLKSVITSHSNSLALFDLAPEDILPKLQPIAISEARERAENVYQFAAQHKLAGEQLWQQLTPKILTELAVRSLALRLKGVIDRVEVYSNTVLPLELKTGKMAQEGVWPSHRVQVAAYMMLLQEKFNTTVSQAIIRYLDHNSTRKVVLNPYMELEVKELTEKVIRLMQSSAVPKPCGKGSCNCTR